VSSTWFFVAVSDCIRRIEQITGKTVPFYEVDILNSAGLREVFSRVSTTWCSTAVIYSNFTTDLNIAQWQYRWQHLSRLRDLRTAFEAIEIQEDTMRWGNVFPVWYSACLWTIVLHLICSWCHLESCLGLSFLIWNSPLVTFLVWRFAIENLIVYNVHVCLKPTRYQLRMACDQKMADTQP
jgi:hypothetical protein